MPCKRLYQLFLCFPQSTSNSAVGGLTRVFLLDLFGSVVEGCGSPSSTCGGCVHVVLHWWFVGLAREVLDSGRWFVVPTESGHQNLDAVKGWKVMARLLFGISAHFHVPYASWLLLLLLCGLEECITTFCSIPGEERIGKRWRLMVVYRGSVFICTAVLLFQSISYRWLGDLIEEWGLDIDFAYRP